MPSKPSLSVLPDAMQQGKRSRLANQRPLTPLEVAHVCRALLRLAQQLQETPASDTIVSTSPDCLALNTLKENNNA